MTETTLKNKLRRFLIKLILPKTERSEWQVCLCGEKQGIVVGRCDELWSAVFNATNRIQRDKNLFAKETNVHKLEVFK